MKLFVDASAWVAYYDNDDQWHLTAKTAINSLINQATQLITTDYVLDEAITLLLYHIGWHHAVKFGEEVQRSRQVKIVRINTEPGNRTYLEKSYDFLDGGGFKSATT